MTENHQLPEERTSSSGTTTGGSPENLPNISIPDHTLLRPIGRGSYGEVWMARSSMGMLRAVKIVYRKSFQDKRPFERELSGIRKFEPISRSHEGFIDVLHAGINDVEGYFYYIMELGDDLRRGQDIDPANYVPRTLSRELAPSGKLPTTRCLSLGLALSQALAELHKHGLVHRDIKPSNIIFVNGAPKLADIGLVAEFDEARSYVGTEGFIPPEGPGTPQADIYGLGKVLYEACTGKDRQDFPDLPTNWDQGPEYNLFLELNEVILEACKSDLTLRYQSALDMHADLVLLSNGKSVKRLKLLERRLVRLRNLAVVAGLGLLVLAAIGYQVYWQWRTRFEARQRQVGGNVVNGTLAEESGDPFGAVSYFLQALALDQGEPGRESQHRLRLGSVLSQCPKMEKMFFLPREIARIDLCQDGEHVLGVESFGQARILELKTGEAGPPLPEQHLFDAAYNPAGTLVIVAAERANQNCAAVWRLDEMKCILTLPHPDRVLSASFSPHGSRILTACKDGVARLWSSQAPTVERKLAAHSAAVVFAGFSQDGHWIVTCSRDSTAMVWSADDETLAPKVLTHGASNWVIHASFSSDSRLLVTACSDHKARVFDVETARQILPDLTHGAGVNSAQFSPDGRFILTAGLDFTARIWLTDTHQLLRPAGVLGHSGRVLQAIFAPDGHHVITCCDDGTVRLWNLAAEDLLPVRNSYSFNAEGTTWVERVKDLVQVKRSSGKVLSQWTNSSQDALFQLSGNGRFIASFPAGRPGAGNQLSHVEIRDTATGTLIGPGLAVSNLVQALVLDDGKTVITVEGERSIRRWDVMKGSLHGAVIQSKGNISAAFISRDGRRVGVWSANYVEAWDLATGQPMFAPIKTDSALTYATFSYATFSPDGSRLLTCSRDPFFARCAAQIYEVSGGKPLPFKLGHDDGVAFADFSADGRRIVTAGEDFTARIWDARTGAQLTPPLKHGNRVNSAVFSLDGKWVLTTSSDWTARVWSAETGDPLTPPLLHGASVRSGRFIPATDEILTVDVNLDQWRWKLRSEDRALPELAGLAQVLSGSTLTRWGGLSAANTNSLKDNWRHLQTTLPEAFAVSDSQIAAWHDFQARESEIEDNRRAAVFHLKEALLHRPEDRSLQARLSAAEAQLNEGHSRR